MQRTIEPAATHPPLASPAARPVDALALALAFAIFFVILALRRPGTPIHAEFWGEDGWVWYPEAYRFGWAHLLNPVSGYLQTISRLVGILVQPFPLTWAPGLFATAALAGQAATATFLISSRMAEAWPSLPGRLLFALLYLALPNSWEVYGNLTNLQWHLGIFSFLVLVSAPPAGWAGRAFDTAVLTISGLSGPSCVFLVPLALWQIYERRDRTSLWRAAIVLAAASVQLSILLTTMADSRTVAPLGAGPRLLTRIVSMQVFLGALLGEHRMHQYIAWRAWQTNVMPVAVFLAGLGLCAAALARGLPVLRKGCAIAAMMLVAALLRPNVGETAQWVELSIPATGARYFVVPMLAWIGVLLTLAADRTPALRLTGAALCVLMITQLPRDWFYPTLPPTGFQDAARSFMAAPAGTEFKFNMNPPNNTWTLTKR